MKKLILFFSIIMFAFVSMAQTNPTSVSVDATISNAYYKYVWGTTSDTLTNADTLNFVFRIKGDEVMNMNMKLYSDFVSGSAGGTLKAYSSIDGVNYALLDTSITVTALEADAMDAETITISNYNYPYLKLIYLQSGTAVTIPKVYVYAKYN